MRYATKKECQSFGLLKSFRRLGIPIRARCWEPNPFKNTEQINNIEIYSRSDCSTRSMCKVLNEPYESIFNQQIVLAQRFYLNYAHIVVIDYIMESHGYQYSISHDDVDNTVLSFMLSHLKDRYVLITNDHAVAYIDGTLYDNFDPKNIEEGFSMVCSKMLHGWYSKSFS